MVFPENDRLPCYPLVNCYVWKITLLKMGKSTINHGPFSIANCKRLPEPQKLDGWFIMEHPCYKWMTGGSPMTWETIISLAPSRGTSSGKREDLFLGEPEANLHAILRAIWNNSVNPDWRCGKSRKPTWDICQEQIDKLDRTTKIPKKIWGTKN